MTPPGRKATSGASRGADHEAFVARWNALTTRDRRRMRRLVRMGRPLDTRQDAELAVAYAGFQSSRPWARTFWIWFVPGIVLALAAATKVHPVLVGVVLALGGQAIYARVNLRRTEKVNAALLPTKPVQQQKRRRR